MSIQLVESEIRRFLSTEDPEVICVSGHWGVGKTFAWNLYLRQAQQHNKIALKRYSYVSLFGVNSLDELKFAVFENSVKTSEVGISASLETLESDPMRVIDSITRKGARTLVGAAQKTPALQSFLGGLAPVWFSSVRENVICIDDFERRGKNLSVRDVLGLVNNLKEIKRCKICLILNDEALEDDEEEFHKYLEKVVDTRLKFQPSAEDCVRVALTNGSDISKLISEHCVKLGISNIRVIKKIERSVRQVENLVGTFNKQVLRQAVHSLCLLGWSILEPAKAPSLEYIKGKDAVDFLGIEKQTPVSDKEAAWNAMLASYEFSSMDEFDLALLEGVRNGYFDPSVVTKYALELDKKFTAGNLGLAFEKAWRMYHDSFDDNKDQVLDAIHDSFLKGIEYITPLNMSSTITVFKELGRQIQAKEMLKAYIEARANQRQVFDLANYPFSDRVSDPDVITAFNEKYAAFTHHICHKEVLLRIADQHGWNPEDITALAALPVDGYYKIFKSNTGSDLRRLVNACLMFDSMMDSTHEYQEIPKRAKEALKRIGQESTINAIRVKKYGVKVEQPTPEDLSKKNEGDSGSKV